MQRDFSDHIKFIEETGTKILCDFCVDYHDQEDTKLIYLSHQYICKKCVAQINENTWASIAPDGISEEEKQSVLKQLNS